MSGRKRIEMRRAIGLFLMIFAIGLWIQENESKKQEAHNLAKAATVQANSAKPAPVVEPTTVEFYTGNSAFFGATVKVINYRGDNVSGQITLDRKTGWHKLRLPSPGNLAKGYTVVVWYADGRGYSVFQTDKLPAYDYDGKVPIYLVITGCVSGGIPAMYVNFAANGERVWPVGYKGPTDCK